MNGAEIICAENPLVQLLSELMAIISMSSKCLTEFPRSGPIFNSLGIPLAVQLSNVHSPEVGSKDAELSRKRNSKYQIK